MSALKRVYAPLASSQGPRITVDDPQERHHLTHVLRVKAGERVECFDGRGGLYEGIVERIGSGSLEIRVERRRQQQESGCQLTLAQGIPKRDRFEWVVEKATELGVARIVPLLTAHTVVRLDPAQGAKKRERWHRIAQEAAKQCRRATVPEIEAPQLFQEFLPAAAQNELALMATLACDAQPLKTVLQGRTGVRHALILIGPEGDFSAEEIGAAQQRGVTLVSLGGLTLRSETAAIAALAVLQHALGGS